MMMMIMIMIGTSRPQCGMRDENKKHDSEGDDDGDDNGDDEDDQHLNTARW